LRIAARPRSAARYRRDDDVQWVRWRSGLCQLLSLAIVWQSLLTVACSLDELNATRSAASAVAVDLPGESGASAADLPDESDSGETHLSPATCVSCGGVLTANGCCAHGAPLAQRNPEPAKARSELLIPDAAGSPLPPTLPSERFRPPIRA
jgi:hypothetical protein